MDSGVKFENSDGCKITKIKKLEFLDTENKDVYNISKKFVFMGKDFLFGRVEPRDNSELSKIKLFGKEKGKWLQDKKFIPLNDSEDPFIFKINQKLILGCVKVKRTEVIHKFNSNSKLNYRTILYDLSDLYSPKKIFEGPWKMKDIRFIELENGSIGVFSRPQGGKAGRGKIGFTITKSIESLSHDDLNNAKLLEYFEEDEWGGANDVALTKEGKLFVLGHIAKKDELGLLHYRPMHFIFDPINKVGSSIKILFERGQLPEGACKNERVKDVIFPGGFEKNEKGNLEIYLGAGDAESYLVEVNLSKDYF